VRVAVQALAAVLGGRSHSTPTPATRRWGCRRKRRVRIACARQQILAHESGVAEVVDPLGGSYAVEALTTASEADAQTYSTRSIGWVGCPPAIEMGFVRRRSRGRLPGPTGAGGDSGRWWSASRVVSEATARVPGVRGGRSDWPEQ